MEIKVRVTFIHILWVESHFASCIMFTWEGKSIFTTKSYSDPFASRRVWKLESHRFLSKVSPRNVGIVNHTVGDATIMFLWVFRASCLEDGTSFINAYFSMQGAMTLLINTTILILLVCVLLSSIGHRWSNLESHFLCCFFHFGHRQVFWHVACFIYWILWF